MSNQWKQFAALIPGDPLLVGTVLSHEADGTSTVQLPDGGILRPQGQDVTVGDRAFVQSNRVQGEAPALLAVEVNV